MDEPLRCHLELAVGRVAACPAERCAFWEPGGAALPGSCAVERLALDARPDLASWLLSVRARLEAAAETA
jgi:hypothetical protein